MTIKYASYASIAFALITTLGHAATPTVTTVPPQKASFDSKKPLFITNEGAYDCKDDYDLYVRAVAPPKSKDPKVPLAQGDFESFYFAKSANPAQPAIIVSRPGIQEYVPACIQVK